MINILNSKYKYLYLCIINTGFVTEHICEKYLKISKKVLTNLCKKGVLKVEKEILFGTMTNIYTFTVKSIGEVRKESFNLYKSDTSQLEHDYCLLKLFAALPDNLKENWINETTLKIKFGKKSITTDAIIINKNKKIGIEVFTDSYTREMKNDRVNFIKKYCDDSIILKTTLLSRR
ncbi:MAG: hypothetical protein ACLS2V_12875 [Clostridium paraputrificum]|uniref:hypothetical protein n=1 Tax=Clostridium sp. TaxID=1506 RepID=UPI0025BD7856|nr:hypothetical protein [Clostridium sp.]MBS5926236.1 hypothetical protein [Clostridium sp.]